MILYILLILNILTLFFIVLAGYYLFIIMNIVLSGYDIIDDLEKLPRFMKRRVSSHKRAKPIIKTESTMQSIQVETYGERTARLLHEHNKSIMERSKNKAPSLGQVIKEYISKHKS